MNNFLLLVIVSVFMIGLENLLGVEQPNESKAVRLGFQNEKAVEDFDVKVQKYGSALYYLNKKAEEKNEERASDVLAARAFIEVNKNFDAQLRKFLLGMTETYGVTILGRALKNAYYLGLKGEFSYDSVKSAIDTINRFKKDYGKMIDNSERVIGELRREAMMPLKVGK